MNCNEVTSAIFYDLSSSGWMEMFGLVELHVAETAAELKPLLDKVEAASQLGHFAIGYICYEAASGLDTSLSHRPKHSYPLAIFAEFIVLMSLFISVLGFGILIWAIFGG